MRSVPPESLETGRPGALWRKRPDNGRNPAEAVRPITFADSDAPRARRSRQCVINLPTVDLIDTVVTIGNCHGNEVDKFAQFGLTARRATKVKAPLIAECYANFECRLHEDRMIRSYGLFIWEVVKAHVAVSPKRPQTIHYRGDGEFMLSGGWLSRRGHFKSGNL
jgi:flavin reductase (DIM6/NTAB) family NADH-FMN oxidoreductase RutF